ncbi:MAG: hypothetical protein AAGK00_12860 [Pseudomonadota bacterium]
MTQVALSLDSPAPAELKALIHAQRDLARRNIQQAFAAIGPTPDAAQQAFLDAAQNSNDAIGALRRAVDQMLAVPADQRDAVNAEALPFQLKREVSRMKSASTTVSAANDQQNSAPPPRRKIAA